MKKEMTGAEIVWQALVDEGVEVIFGLPGGVIIPTYDALVDYPQLKHVLVRHEQGATHMADGYARASDRVGVVMVTSGPGATNIVTGLLTAYMDSVPMVAITGQVAVSKIGQDAFQEADTVGITRPCTKHNYLVTDVTKLADIIHEAFYIARTGKPGPVVVDLPVNVQREKAAYHGPKEVNLRSYNPRTEGHNQQIDKVAKAIARAERPVIYAGHGVIRSGAAAELAELARKTQIPVTTTVLGLGAFPETDPLSLGMLGMHGTWYSNTAVDQCDLLIAVGARFDDRITANPSEFSQGSVKVHIDIDPTAISKVVKTEYPVVGDVRKVLKSLIPKVGQVNTNGWLEQIREWKFQYPMQYGTPEPDGRIFGQYVIQKISELTGGNAVVTTDVGQHQMWTAQYYQFNKPRSCITSGGLGTMGFGFPAAIGAKFARPDEDVWVVSGDGSIQMCFQELSVAMEYKQNIKVVILNNGFLGMVRQWQDLFWDDRFSQTQLEQSNPDFVKLAEAYGAVGMRAVKTSEVEPMLRKAMEVKDRPVFMDVLIPKDANVFPMIPAGTSIKQMRYDK